MEKTVLSTIIVSQKNAFKVRSLLIKPCSPMLMHCYGTLFAYAWPSIMLHSFLKFHILLEGFGTIISTLQTTTILKKLIFLRNKAQGTLIWKDL